MTLKPIIEFEKKYFSSPDPHKPFPNIKLTPHHSSLKDMSIMLLPYQKYILGSKRNTQKGFYIFGNAHHVLCCSTFYLKIGSKVFFASHTASIEANHENKELSCLTFCVVLSMLWKILRLHQALSFTSFIVFCRVYSDMFF